MDHDGSRLSLKKTFCCQASVVADGMHVDLWALSLPTYLRGLCERKTWDAWKAKKHLKTSSYPRPPDLYKNQFLPTATCVSDAQSHLKHSTHFQLSENLMAAGEFVRIHGAGSQRWYTPPEQQLHDMISRLQSSLFQTYRRLSQSYFQGPIDLFLTCSGGKRSNCSEFIGRLH